ncbi:MAG TPA: DUF5818 domain-containing protein [Candidatus Sulfotelmatobacter sp.]|nr:DUF5818 domain-containing protein [Candidatus Sulfotelmatobacter sp.]
MKEILNRLLLAFAITLVAIAPASWADAQQTNQLPQVDEDQRPVAPQSQQAPDVSQSGAQQGNSKPDQPNATTPTKSGDEDQTQDALTFTGRIVQQNGQLLLRDPVTKVDYQLDDPSKATAYLGKQVKIVGKLGMKKNTIHIDRIEPAS